jgi:hypothetical protein
LCLSISQCKISFSSNPTALTLIRMFVYNILESLEFILAAEIGDVQTFIRLLGDGVDVNCKDCRGNESDINLRVLNVVRETTL